MDLIPPPGTPPLDLKGKVLVVVRAVQGLERRGSGRWRENSRSRSGLPILNLLMSPFSHFSQPAVAIGNVGQLAVSAHTGCVCQKIKESNAARAHSPSPLSPLPSPSLFYLPRPSQADLLITSLALPSRGLLHSPDLLPCLGLDAVNDGPAAVAGPAQLYGREADGWAVLHQRSPAAPGRAAAHAAALAAWARAAGAASLLILGSIDARARRGVDLDGGGSGGAGPRALVHRVAAAPAPGHPAAAALAARAAAAAGSARLADIPGDPPFAEGRLPPWPLMRECEGGGGGGGGEAAPPSCAPPPPPLPALALLAFAAEGDNAGDAASLASGAAGVLGVGVPEGGWVAPRAWAALYGGGGGV
jgi:hypothetical protein